MKTRIGWRRLAASGYGALRRAGKVGAVALALCASAAAAEVKIVALGDSLVAGYGLPAEEGFVPELNDWLDANGAPEAEVVNAGVSGDTTAGGRARLDWALGDGADGLIVALGGNDLLRGIDPAESRANLDAILTEAGERGLPVLLTGLEAPKNYGPEFKADFDAMYPELAREHGAIYDPSFLKGVVGTRDLFQPDGIHPNADGVEALVARFGPLVLDLVARAE